MIKKQKENLVSLKRQMFYSLPSRGQIVFVKVKVPFRN